MVPVKPGRASRGLRCWRKALQSKVAALILVSSTAATSLSIGSKSTANKGNITCLRVGKVASGISDICSTDRGCHVAQTEGAM